MGEPTTYTMGGQPPAEPPAILCPRCGRAWPAVEAWPLRCTCGQAIGAGGEPLADQSRAWRWGDRLAAWLARWGVRACGGCKRRQAWLNRVSGYVGGRWRRLVAWWRKGAA